MKKDDKRMKRGHSILKKMGRVGLLDNQKEIYPDLHELTVGHLFGDIWTRPHLSLRDRELITLAANVALARTTGVSHFHSALHIGITKEQIMELIIHVGHYSGWPNISLATRQFNKVLKANAEAKKLGKARTPKQLAQAWESNG